MKNNLNLGIYIHIPFCISKCHYCDFCSSPANEETKEQYIKALIKQISEKKTAEFFYDYTVDTIYFGGGTPTCLNPERLNEVLNAVAHHYSVSNDSEITIECNPGTVNFDNLSNLKEGGFNRLSIGLQSVHDHELKALGRIHNFEDFDKTFSSARRAGFDNISLDLMYGIPNQTISSFNQTMDVVADYNPEHISAYSLKIEPGTFFYKNKDKLILPDEDCEYNMYDSAVDFLEKAGYKHYEISNYAKNGYRSKHNLKYWNCDDFIGFGVAAHSCVGTKRYSSTVSIKDYIGCDGRLDNSCISIEESLSSEEFAEEYIMMRMRLSEGISITEYNKKFGDGFEKKYLPRMMPYVKSGHIIYKEECGNLCFSKEGMYVSNYILSSILDLGM